MLTKKIVSFLALTAAIGFVVIQPTAVSAPLPAAIFIPIRDAWEGETFSPGQGCSTVYATDGQQMLGGNNEDSLEPLT